MKILNQIPKNRKVSITELGYSEDQLKDYIDDLIEATRSNNEEILELFSSAIDKTARVFEKNSPIVELMVQIAINNHIQVRICHNAIWFLTHKVPSGHETKKEILYQAFKNRSDEKEKVDLCFWTIRSACGGNIKDIHIINDIYAISNENIRLFLRNDLLEEFFMDFRHRRREWGYEGIFEEFLFHSFFIRRYFEIERYEFSNRLHKILRFYDFDRFYFRHFEQKNEFINEFFAELFEILLKSIKKGLSLEDKKAIITFLNIVFRFPKQLEKTVVNGTYALAKSSFQEGKITYAIPSEMYLRRAYVCSIKIAFDLQTLLRELNYNKYEYSEIESIFISSKLQIDVYDVDDEFRIKWLCPQIQSLVEGQAAEWLFSLKPLTDGEHLVCFCVSAFFDSGENNPPIVRVFSKEVKVIINIPHYLASPFLPSVAVTDFTSLPNLNITTSIQDTINEIVRMIDNLQIYEAFTKIDEIMNGKTHPLITSINELKQKYIIEGAKFDFYGRFKTCVWIMLSETLISA